MENFQWLFVLFLFVVAGLAGELLANLLKNIEVADQSARRYGYHIAFALLFLVFNWFELDLLSLVPGLREIIATLVGEEPTTVEIGSFVIGLMPTLSGLIATQFASLWHKAKDQETPTLLIASRGHKLGVAPAPESSPRVANNKTRVVVDNGMLREEAIAPSSVRPRSPSNPPPGASGSAH